VAKDFFFSLVTSRLAVGPSQTPIQRFPAVKQPEREVNNSPPSSTPVKLSGVVPLLIYIYAFIGRTGITSYLISSAVFLKIDGLESARFYRSAYVS
jgi:hypothetical protein